MIGASEWFDEATRLGFDFLTGVPCSFLTPFINYAIGADRTTYVGASSEGEAAAIAAGAWLGGRRSIVMCQNSGLGNLVNPLTSLQWPFRIPTLIVVTWRGQEGLGDQPQHGLMGRATDRILDAIEIEHELFPTESEAIVASLARADAAMRKSELPFAFVMRKGSVAPWELKDRPRVTRAGTRVERRPFPEAPHLTRGEAVALAVDILGPDRAYLASTGKLGRELFTLGDGPNRFYNVGAMGCVGGIGLGVALTRPQRGVVVLDGDGSMLMKMGTLATIGHYAPENLLHVVLDNERHESTGGQSTVSSTVDFAAIAAGAGYRHAFSAGAVDDVRDVLEQAREVPGPTLVHLKVGVATDPNLGRPTIAPPDVARRFRTWLA